ncbi:MAG: hypothetical protein IT426_18840 [Pirellulales bacterium]|nr:hypothetical protein [Pirellulales bacterium]
MIHRLAYPGLSINIVDAASCRILGKSGKMPLLQIDFMNNAGYRFSGGSFGILPSSSA